VSCSVRWIWVLCAVVVMHTFPLTRCFGLRAWILRKRGIRIGQGARIAGGSRFIGRGRMTVGAQTWLGPYGLYVTHPDASIQIGARCDIAPEVCFVTGTHDFGDAGRRAGRGKALPILVGDGCWLGARVTVLGGASIGDGAIIAAGAVVAADIPPHTLAGGVPAKVIRHLGSPVR
jgi:acetyltransferase-like isoleucine patch superfamily enzyme